MSLKKELRQLSKNELIDMIFLRDERISKLEDRLKKIEQYLKAFDNENTPSSKKLKKNTKKKDDDKKGAKPRFPGKPKGSNGGGIKLPEPDRLEEYKLKFCPISGLPLGEPIGYFTKKIIDHPDKPIEVIEHRIYKYLSPTGKVVYAKVELPKGIYGPNIRASATLLKSLGLSFGKIKAYFHELGAPSICGPSILSFTDKIAQKLSFTRGAYLRGLQKRRIVHKDETDLRKDGINGKIWGFGDVRTIIYSAAMSRGRDITIKIIPPREGMVSVVDGYAAYLIYKILQRCWAHLLRKAENEAKQFEELEIYHTRLKLLYHQLKIWKKEPPDDKIYNKAKFLLMDIVTCLESEKHGTVLATYIKNGGEFWFTALKYPGVPLTNNFMERMLRTIVVLRKMMGCYRNDKGKRFIDVIMSVVGTWKLRKINIYQKLAVVAKTT